MAPTTLGPSPPCLRGVREPSRLVSMAPGRDVPSGIRPRVVAVVSPLVAPGIYRRLPEWSKPLGTSSPCPHVLRSPGHYDPRSPRPRNATTTRHAVAKARGGRGSMEARRQSAKTTGRHLDEGRRRHGPVETRGRGAPSAWRRGSMATRGLRPFGRSRAYHQKCGRPGSRGPGQGSAVDEPDRSWRRLPTVRRSPRPPPPGRLVDRRCRVPRRSRGACLGRLGLEWREPHPGRGFDPRRSVGPGGRASPVASPIPGLLDSRLPVCFRATPAPLDRDVRAVGQGRGLRPGRNHVPGRGGACRVAASCCCWTASC